MSEYNESEVMNMLQGMQALHPLMGESGVINNFMKEHELDQTTPAPAPEEPQMAQQNNWDFLKGPGA